MYVSIATAGDIAITAAEGGIGYWSQIETYRWTRWQNEDGSPNPMFSRRNSVFYRLVDIETGKRHVVTTNVIQRGVNLFLNGSIENNQFAGRPFDDMDDLSMMDAAEADCVIQLGLFAKLIYG